MVLIFSFYTQFYHGPSPRLPHSQALRLVKDSNERLCRDYVDSLSMDDSAHEMTVVQLSSGQAIFESKRNSDTQHLLDLYETLCERPAYRLVVVVVVVVEERRGRINGSDESSTECSL